MKRPRVSTILFFAALPAIMKSEIVSPSNNNNDDSANSSGTDNLMMKLSASQSKTDAPEIPLIGLGVGNLPHNRIPFLLAKAMDSHQADGSSEAQYRLVDTSHTNPALEVLVGRSLGRLLTNDNSSHKEDYHVIIKIWHTHFGYERTLNSVHDSLSHIFPGVFFSGAALDPSSWKKDLRVKVHAIIQYPRCYDTLFTSKYYQSSPNFPVKYSNCYEEEDAFARSFTSTDSSPLDDEHAWKKSYRALEELYHRGVLHSIGVSNFGPTDMSTLYDYATVGPHLYMGTLHTLLEEEEMVEEMIKHGVHYICYDAASSILGGKEEAATAYKLLERMGANHSTTPGQDDSNGYSAVQLVLGWLIQRGVTVVPGTADTKHLIENSPQVLSAIPKFGPRMVLDVEMAVRALVRRQDIDDEHEHKKHDIVMETDVDGSDEGAGVVATFFNSFKRNVRIFKIHPTTGRQIPLSSSIAPGRSGRIMVDTNDVLVAYDGYGTALKKFLVEDQGVGRVDFAVEL